MKYVVQKITVYLQKKHAFCIDNNYMCLISQNIIGQFIGYSQAFRV